MGRWSVASRLCKGAASSQIYGLSGGTFQNLGVEPQLKCRHLAAGMATKSGDGDGKGSAKWRDWVEDKIAKTPPSPSSEKKSTSSSNAVDDFERYVLGKTGDDEEEEEYHEIRESVDPVLQRAAAGEQQKNRQDDEFLEELTNIERGGGSFPSDFGKKDQSDVMMKRGYDDDKVPFDDEIDPENDESLLASEDAVFWNEELQKFVTPKGLLNLPGLGGKEDFNRPYQLRPDKVYFPGQVIEPEDFDVTRIPSNEVVDMTFRGKKVYRKNEVLAAADFRNVKFLSQFLSETSRILPRRTNALSWKCQRKVTKEIKTARWLGLIPFTSMGDPPFRYLRNRPAKDVDPEDEYNEDFEEEEVGRFRRRQF